MRSDLLDNSCTCYTGERDELDEQVSLGCAQDGSGDARDEAREADGEKNGRRGRSDVGCRGKRLVRQDQQLRVKSFVGDVPTPTSVFVIWMDLFAFALERGRSPSEGQTGVGRELMARATH
jgi:hypothetical protein